MSLISKKFADELTEKAMRVAYLAAQTRTKITAQIRALRSHRGWSQGELARRLDKPQSNVSQRLENREYGGFTLNTLLEVASAFDVGLIVEFVAYQDFLKRTQDLTPNALCIASFSPAALQSLCKDETATDSPEAVCTISLPRPPNEIYSGQCEPVTAAAGNLRLSYFNNPLVRTPLPRSPLLGHPTVGGAAAGAPTYWEPLRLLAPQNRRPREINDLLQMTRQTDLTPILL